MHEPRNFRSRIEKWSLVRDFRRAQAEGVDDLKGWRWLVRTLTFVGALCAGGAVLVWEMGRDFGWSAAWTPILGGAAAGCVLVSWGLFQRLKRRDRGLVGTDMPDCREKPGSSDP